MDWAEYLLAVNYSWITYISRRTVSPKKTSDTDPKDSTVNVDFSKMHKLTPERIQKLIAKRSIIPPRDRGDS